MSETLPLSFSEIHEIALRAAQSRTFNVDVASIANDAVEPFVRLLGSTVLDMQGATVELPQDGEIIVRGVLRLGLKLSCELRFFREGTGVGYCLTFATPNPLSLLKGDLSRLAKLVSLEALWWTGSSRLIPAMRVSIPNLEADALQIRQGFENFHLRFDSPILGALGLERPIFDILLGGEIPSFSTSLKQKIELPPVLSAQFDRMTISTNGVFVFGARAVLRLFGAEVRDVDLNLEISGTHLSLRLPFPVREIQPPPGFPFHAIALRENFVQIFGALPSVSYGFGADGKFFLPKTGNGGSYAFRYNAGTPLPIPDFAELRATKLSVSDAFNLISPIAVSLPNQVDRFLALRDVYAYYAVRAGERSTDGTLLEQGFALRAGVEMFGQRAYFAADVHQSQIRAAILSNPLRIGSIAALTGGGVTTPRGYSGPSFERDAFELLFDTAAGSARTSVAFEFLGQKLQQLNAQLEDGALKVNSETNLPAIGRLDLEFVSGVNRQLEGAFAFKANVFAPLDFGLKIDGLATISGKLKAAQTALEAVALEVTATLEIAKVKVTTSFKIDPDDIRNLADHVLEALKTELKHFFNSAEVLVRAFIEGTLQALDATADAAAVLVTAVVRQFRVSAEQLVRVLKDAGATAGEALDLVRRGAAEFGNFVYVQVVTALRQLFPAQDVMNAMHQWARQFGEAVEDVAQNLAWMLQEGNFVVDQIADEVWGLVGSLERKLELFVSALSWTGQGAATVAKQLKRFGVQVDEAGKLIGRVFGTDILETALSPAYGAQAAARVAGNVVNEMGRFGRNVADEVRRGACRRFGICL